MTNTSLPVFKGNLLIRGKIEALTGLHIGGSNEKMQIGGVDLIVIRDPRDQYPYLPGSSIKGKMRHLLEYITNGVNEPLDGQLGNVSILREIVRLFGIGAEVAEMAHDDKALSEAFEKASEIKEKDKREQKEKSLTYVREKLLSVGLPRLIVRDALPDEETIQMWEKQLGADANFTEYKAENTIDRLTSAANPRFIERVVRGSKFDFEFVYTAYGSPDLSADEIAVINDDVSNILMAMRLLENSALGKAGTRGYGRVKFHLADPIWLLPEHYRDGGAEFLASRKPVGETQELGGFSEAYHYPRNTTTHA